MLESRLRENNKLFVEVIQNMHSDDIVESIEKMNTKKKSAKDEFITDLKTSIKQANDMHSGKIEKRTFQDRL